MSRNFAAPLSEVRASFGWPENMQLSALRGVRFPWAINFAAQPAEGRESSDGPEVLQLGGLKVLRPLPCLGLCSSTV